MKFNIFLYLYRVDFTDCKKFTTIRHEIQPYESKSLSRESADGDLIISPIDISARQYLPVDI